MRRLLSILPPQQISRIRSLYYSGKQRFVKRFLSYGTGQLVARFRELGIQAGDTLMVHSSFDPLSGFRGSPSDFIETVLEVIGSSGNLLMVSLPYRSSTHEYLSKLKVFDVRKAVSQMGLVSETFRRRPGVLRSLNPSHPVLAIGPDTEWIIAGHEHCLYPCGLGTPFEKLAQLKGKVLFFNASFFSFTFLHHVEDLLKDKLTFPLYFDEPVDVPAIDYQGNQIIVRTYVFSQEAIRRRRPEILEDQMQRRGLIRRASIGNSEMLLVETNQTITCVNEMTQQGIFFHELSESPSKWEKQDESLTDRS